jgi:cytochrome d ubiquinol oxidase subunit II
MYFVIMFTWMMYLCQELFISGASALNISLSKDESERKQIQVTSGLHFDGMEVWLVTAIALMFGIYPQVFGEVLSHLYVVFFILLYVIIARGVSIEVIYKMEDKRWQKTMSYVWMISSILLLLLLGVYITNMFYGYPYDGGMTKGFLSVLNVTSISGGLLFVVLSFTAGSGWIHLTVTGDLKTKALKFVKKIGVIYMVPVLVLLIGMGFNNSDSSIYTGEIFSQSFLWFILPITTVAFATLVLWFGYIEDGKKMFVFSILTMFFYLLTGFVGSFPNVLLSRINPSLSLTVSDVMASYNAMNVIFIAVCIFYPIIIGYQSWKYVRFSGNIKPNDE